MLSDTDKEQNINIHDMTAQLGEIVGEMRGLKELLEVVAKHTTSSQHHQHVNGKGRALISGGLVAGFVALAETIKTIFVK